MPNGNAPGVGPPINPPGLNKPKYIPVSEAQYNEISGIIAVSSMDSQQHKKCMTAIRAVLAVPPKVNPLT